MTAVLFQPHSDDAALFASFITLRHNPHVVTVLRSVRQDSQGVSHDRRAMEDVLAFAELRVPSHEQWPEPDTTPDYEAVEAMMRALDESISPERVFAPAPEDGGHEQHNAVGRLAELVYPGRVTLYLTYTGGRERSTWGEEVEPEPEWISRKLRALACYRSQHELWSTAHHFLACQREYVAP